MLRVASSSQQTLPQPGDDKGRSEFTTYLKTQAKLITNDWVLRSAVLKDEKLRGNSILARADDPVKFLEEELKVEWQENSELIKISLTGDNAPEVAAIVNAVRDAYIREVVDVEQKQKEFRLGHLGKVIETTANQLRSLFPTLKKPIDGSEDAASPKFTAATAQDRAHLIGEIRKTRM